MNRDRKQRIKRIDSWRSLDRGFVMILGLQHGSVELSSAEAKMADMAL